MELRIFGITFRGSWRFGDDPRAQGPVTTPALQPIPVPFAVARTGSADAREILTGHSFATLKAAYGQSLAIARQMLRDGTHCKDASGFAALCFGLDLLGTMLPIDGIPKDHLAALLPGQPLRRRPPDDGDTTPPLPSKKPRKRGRGNDRD
ncbi:MAG: hypothetical protein HY055_09265 [Magnetospirillum sp.]|nr:hypothetical protein [Magnetospirillum sp.]